MSVSPEVHVFFDSVATIDTPPTTVDAPPVSVDAQWDAYWAEDLDRIVRSMDATDEAWPTRLDIE